MNPRNPQVKNTISIKENKSKSTRTRSHPGGNVKRNEEREK